MPASAMPLRRQGQGAAELGISLVVRNATAHSLSEVVAPRIAGLGRNCVLFRKDKTRNADSSHGMVLDMLRCIYLKNLLNMGSRDTVSQGGNDG